MAEKQFIGRCWYATAVQVYEVNLLPGGQCVVPAFGEIPDMPLNMLWGKDDGGFVFTMGRMPKDKNQLKLPVIVEGGYLTGNKEVADAMYAMLRGVAAQAVQASLFSFAKMLETTGDNTEAEVRKLPKLPTVLGSEPVVRTASGRPPKDQGPADVPPQADADSDDGPDSDSDYIVG